MKSALLYTVALLCLILIALSLFSGGRIRLFGLPVSGLLFVVIFRAVCREIER